MTAGMPGAGIGGLFYLLNALSMPLHELRFLWKGSSTPETRKVAVRQFALAVSILGSMWLFAWTLSIIFAARPRIASFAGISSQSETVRQLPRILTYSTLMVGVVTLGFVLLSVVILRFVVGKTEMRPNPARLLLLVLALVLFSENAVAAQSLNHLQRADAAFADENAVLAIQEYRAVIAEDPAQSHATFRLAQLVEKENPAESEQLFRRYIEQEPADLWGYIALADFLGRRTRYDEATELYADAARRAPDESDAVCGLARMLAKSGRTSESIQTYNEWLRSHPHDEDATVEVESQRLLLAPTIEPTFSWSHDSDGNTRIRTAMDSDFALSNRSRLGLTVGRSHISDGASTRTSADFTVTGKWRPSSTLQMDAAGGATRIDTTLLPTARLRMLSRTASNSARFDARLTRTVLDATPGLTANRVVRSEAQLRPDFAIPGRFRIRGTGGFGRLTGQSEVNHRYTVGGGAAWNVTPDVEISANMSQVRYSHATQAGYFAPERIHAMDLGSYMEFEKEHALIALEFGAGAERLKERGSAFGPWRPAFRGYGLVALQLSRESELRFEVDGYNTLASQTTAATSGWKYVSASTSLRWSF